MRFEHASAYAMGVGLPLLEALRRRTNFTTIAGYVDDFIAGALLLYAARAVSRGRRNGPVLLVAAWAVLCGGLYSSFFGQLESSARTDVSGLDNASVVVVKGILYAIALASLFLSVRTAALRSAVFACLLVSASAPIALAAVEPAPAADRFAVAALVSHPLWVGAKGDGVACRAATTCRASTRRCSRPACGTRSVPSASRISS